MRARTLTVFLGLIALGGAASAPAAMIATPIKTAIAQLQEWNLITFNNFNAANEVEGRVFVGGDYNGITNEQFNFKGSTSKNGTGALTVVGNASGDKVDLTGGDFIVGGNSTVETIEGHDQGKVYAGGTVGGKNVHAPVESGLSKSQSDFTSTLNQQKELLVATMTDLSKNLAALASTGKLDTKDNAINFTASSGVNVINTTIADLQAYSTNYINIVSPKGTTTIINVAGKGGTIDRNFNDNGSTNNIIWNFYEATDLTLGNWQGSVLAVNADFVKDNQGNLQGTVVAKSASTYAELHSYGFQGDLSSATGTATVVSATPEPSTWAMLILGFGAIGWAMRLRTRPRPAMAAQPA